MSIFAKIVSGQIPCYKIMEDEHHLAFLDVQALAKGHTLVIPKKEIDLIWDLDDQAYLNLMAFAKKVAHKITAAIPCKRVGMAVVGLEVPHAHVHLVPLNTIGDISFTNPRLQLSADEMTAIQQQITN
jgi:histidine triad (HIT) family protein